MTRPAAPPQVGDNVANHKTSPDAGGGIANRPNVGSGRGNRFGSRALLAAHFATGVTWLTTSGGSPLTRDAGSAIRAPRHQSESFDA